MELPQYLTVKFLVTKYVKDKVRAKSIADKIKSGDPNVETELEEIASNYRYDYGEILKKEGPQGLTHSAWFHVARGRYYFARGLQERALESLYQAYNIFDDEDNTGHEDTARKLAQEYPEIFEVNKSKLPK